MFDFACLCCFPCSSRQHSEAGWQGSFQLSWCTCCSSWCYDVCFYCFVTRDFPLPMVPCRGRFSLLALFTRMHPSFFHCHLGPQARWLLRSGCCYILTDEICCLWATASEVSIVQLNLHMCSFGLHWIYTVCGLNYPIYAVKCLFVAETQAL